MSTPSTPHALPKKYKIVVVGDQSVGKTSIIKRFIDGSFQQNYSPTIGIDFLCKSVYLSDEKSVRFQIWDTAGQERFKSLIPSYIRDSNVCLIIYDITSRKSFLNGFKWLEEVRCVHPNSDKVLIWMVGNKFDLAVGYESDIISKDQQEKRIDEKQDGKLQGGMFGRGGDWERGDGKDTGSNIRREVSFEELRKKCEENEVHKCIETSAKNGMNVKRLFQEIAESLPEVFNEESILAEQRENYFVVPLSKDDDEDENKIGKLKSSSGSSNSERYCGYC